jgi:hypothetical protein
MFPADLLFAKACDVVDDFLNFFIAEVEFHHFGYFFEVFEGEGLFFFKVDQIEHGPSSFSAERVAEFVGEFFEEQFEVDPLAIELLGDFLEAFVNKFVFFIKAEGLGSVEDVSNIAFPSVVTVQVEHVEEVFAMLSGEDGVFCDDLFRKDLFSFLLGQLLAVDNHCSKGFDD